MLSRWMLLDAASSMLLYWLAVPSSTAREVGRTGAGMVTYMGVAAVAGSTLLGEAEPKKLSAQAMRYRELSLLIGRVMPEELLAYCALITLLSLPLFVIRLGV